MKYRQQWTRVSGMRFFRLMLTSSCRYFSYWSLMNFMIGCQLQGEAPSAAAGDGSSPVSPGGRPPIPRGPAFQYKCQGCGAFLAETAAFPERLHTSLPC